MLRITTQSDNGQMTLRLEGRLAEAWVAEVRRCYREATQACPIVVADLDDVTFIDEAGSTLLGEMFRNGVALRSADPLMKSIIEEVSLREVGKQ